MKAFLHVLSLMAVAYTLLCVYLFVMQERLLFLPPAIDKAMYDSVAHNRVAFNADGKQIAGWRTPVDDTQSFTIMYFSGNAGDAVYAHYDAQHLSVKQMFAFNYAGYGESQGEPGEASFYQNALDMYDYVTRQQGVNAQKLVLVGRSLGSAVASYLASQRQVAALVLVTPFDSIENVAANQYKLFPVRLLIKHRFATEDNIRQVKSPILVVAAEEDEIISSDNLGKLQQSLNGSGNGAIRMVKLAQVGHNTIQMHPQYYASINEFLRKLGK